MRSNKVPLPLSLFLSPPHSSLSPLPPPFLSLLSFSPLSLSLSLLSLFLSSPPLSFSPYSLSLLTPFLLSLTHLSLSLTLSPLFLCPVLFQACSLSFSFLLTLYLNIAFSLFLCLSPHNSICYSLSIPVFHMSCITAVVQVREISYSRTVCYHHWQSGQAKAGNITSMMDVCVAGSLSEGEAEEASGDGGSNWEGRGGGQGRGWREMLKFPEVSKTLIFHPQTPSQTMDPLSGEAFQTT